MSSPPSIPANAPPKSDEAALAPGGTRGQSTAAAATGPSARVAVGLALCVWIGLLLARATAPSDLLVRDQERVGTYVLDILENGNLLVQHDVYGNVASKPPIFYWLSALTSAVAGGVSRLSLAMPSALACLCSMLLLVVVARRRFGAVAALWVAPLFAFCTLGLRQMLLIRTDPVFALFTFVGAIAAWRAWRCGRGWVWVGLGAAGAALTKGPHGLLLAAVGLTAAFWEQRTGHAASLRGRIWPGAAVFVAVPSAWLFAAWLHEGQPVLDKLFVDELVGHTLGFGQGEVASPGHKFAHPWAWFLTRMLPMSAIAVLGLWRVVRRPAATDDERRFERFLCCWLVGGLLILSAQATVRFIHLLPMMPPAALLASREVARWLRGRSPAFATGAAIVASAGAMLVAWLYLHVVDARTPAIAASERLRLAAADVAARFDVGRLEFVDAPVALQLHLKVFRRVLDPEAAKARIAADEPVLLAVLRTRGEAVVDAPWVHARYPLSDDDVLLLVGNTQTPPGSPPGAPR